MSYIEITCSSCKEISRKKSERMGERPDLCKRCGQRERVKGWKSSNRERALEINRKSQDKNRDRHLATTLAWQALNKERFKANQRCWYEANKERLVEVRRAYRNSDLSKSRGCSKAWRLLHPDSVTAAKHRRRASESGAPGRFSASEWKDKVLLSHGVCFECCKPFDETDFGKVSVGHMIPIAIGGSNYLWNVVPQCMGCNWKQRHSVNSNVTPYILSTPLRHAVGLIGRLLTKY